MPKSKKQLAKEARVGREIKEVVDRDLSHRANNGTPRKEEKQKQDPKK